MFKKVISCLLIFSTAIFCLACFIGCDKEEAPSGMYSATIEGEPFTMYVPDGWYDNRDSGMSSAYYSLADMVMVSSRYYTPYVPEGESFSLENYVYQSIQTYSNKYPKFALIDGGAQKSALGEKEALCLRYNFDRVITSNGVSAEEPIRVVQYYVYHNGDVIIHTQYCAHRVVENEDYQTMLEEIRSEFVFGEKNQANEKITDKKTPAGMKLASFDGCEYRFYVPENWISNTSDKLTEAYYPESEKSNVTVTCYSDAVASADQYFASCEEVYKQDIAGYEFIVREEKKLDVFDFADAQTDVVSYTYRAVYGENEYKIRQTVIIYQNVAYSITYTALADKFELHLADVDKMISEFRFH